MRMGWRHPPTAGATGPSSTTPHSALAKAQTRKYPKPRHGEHSATMRHKTSINQCHPRALIHPLLSAQPQPHFFLAAKAAANTDLPVSPPKGGRDLNSWKIKPAWKKQGVTKLRKQREVMQAGEGLTGGSQCPSTRQPIFLSINYASASSNNDLAARAI